MAQEQGKDVAVRQEETKAVPARAVSPFDEIDRLFESLFPRGWIRPLRWEWPSWPEIEWRVPKVDVIDRDAEVVVKAEVPGVDKKDIEVTTTDNTVTIKGKTSHEVKEEKGDYFRHEMTRGAFSRTVALPGEVDGSQAKASLKDGVLEIVLPKQAKSKRVSVKID